MLKIEAIAGYLEFFKSCLKDEMKRFEVKAISSTWIEYSQHVMTSDALPLWADLQKQADICFHVEEFEHNPQRIYVALSKYQIRRPQQLFLLHHIVDLLEDPVKSPESKLMDMLVFDDLPYNPKSVEEVLNEITDWDNEWENKEENRV